MKKEKEVIEKIMNKMRGNSKFEDYPNLVISEDDAVEVDKVAEDYMEFLKDSGLYPAYARLEIRYALFPIGDEGLYKNFFQSLSDSMRKQNTFHGIGILDFSLWKDEEMSRALVRELSYFLVRNSKKVKYIFLNIEKSLVDELSKTTIIEYINGNKRQLENNKVQLGFYCK